MSALLTETERKAKWDTFLDSLSAYDREPSLTNRAVLRLAGEKVVLASGVTAWQFLAAKRGWIEVLETSHLADNQLEDAR